jgi:hypothetical protein
MESFVFSFDPWLPRLAEVPARIAALTIPAHGVDSIEEGLCHARALRSGRQP